MVNKCCTLAWSQRLKEGDSLHNLVPVPADKASKQIHDEMFAGWRHTGL